MRCESLTYLTPFEPSVRLQNVIGLGGVNSANGAQL